MSPELRAAILDRINRGYTTEQIIAELSAAGYATASLPVLIREATGEEGVRSGKSAELISLTALLTESWQLCKETWRLFGALLVFITLAVLAIGSTLYFLSTSAEEGYISLWLVLGILTPLSVFLLFMVFAFTLYRALLLRGRGESVVSHTGWVVRNIVGLSLLGLYCMAITQLGYAFFFIPGLMATVYLLFVIPVAVTERARGFAALTASTELVWGYFWAVVWRVLAMSLFAMLAYGLFLGVFMAAAAYDLLIGIALVFLGVPVLMLCFYLLTVSFVILYESLLSVPRVPLPVSSRSLTRIYSIAFFVMLAAAAVVFVVMGTLAFEFMSAGW